MKTLKMDKFSNFAHQKKLFVEIAFQFETHSFDYYIEHKNCK